MMDSKITSTPTQVELDSDRQTLARQYARTRRRLSFASLGISVAGVLVLLFSGLGIWLRTMLSRLAWFQWQPLAGWYPWQILVYVLLLVLVYELLTLPLNYSSGYVLAHRYQMSTMSRRAWAGDLVKGLVLSIVLEGVIIEIMYALLATQPQSWWLWVGLVIIFFSVVMANLAPVLLLPLFYTCTPLPEGELTTRLLKLTGAAHTRVRGVYTMQMSAKTHAANAALMGLGNTRRIVIGDTMLDRYTTDEIEVVLAHELGHHVHRDIWKLLLSQSCIFLIGLYLANLAFHWVVDTQHIYQSLADPATLPFLFALMGLFGLLVLPINNGISRAIEYQADAYALQATKKIDAFKSAMTRLANQNLAEAEPAPLIEWLFHNHPSIGKRLRHADAFAQQL
jgi:STE24 endopeptidase